MARLVYEGWIDGEFHGWFGETVVKTLDGRCWKQVDAGRAIRYYHRPAVSIHRGAGLMMSVGDLEARAVVPVDCPHTDKRGRKSAESRKDVARSSRRGTSRTP
jgi:hypothetical protein